MGPKNEHPRCGCRSCRRNSGSTYGQITHKQVNRKIRHETKALLKRDGLDFVRLIVSTPYTD